MLRPVIRLLKRYKLVIVGSARISQHRAGTMVTPPASQFCTPSKMQYDFSRKRKPFKSLDTIPIQPGIHRFYPAISFTQKKGFSKFNLAAYWKRKYRGQQEDEPWYLLTNLTDLKSAMAYRPASYGVYSQRYGIEAMFKDCKTGGYNLEGCQASPDKLIANHDFNRLSHDFSVVTRKKN